MFYPSNKPRRSNNKNLSIKQVNDRNLPLDVNAITGIFNSTTNNYAMRDGRVHCQSVEKTATLIDAHGNKVILREHQTTMNTDKSGPALRYVDGKRTFKKKQYKDVDR